MKINHIQLFFFIAVLIITSLLWKKKDVQKSSEWVVLGQVRRLSAEWTHRGIDWCSSASKIILLLFYSCESSPLVAYYILRSKPFVLTSNKQFGYLCCTLLWLWNSPPLYAIYMYILNTCLEKAKPTMLTTAPKDGKKGALLQGCLI